MTPTPSSDMSRTKKSKSKKRKRETIPTESNSNTSTSSTANPTEVVNGSYQLHSNSRQQGVESSPARKKSKGKPALSASNSSIRIPRPNKISFQLGRSTECNGKTKTFPWTMAQFQDLIFHSLSVKELSIVSNCCAEYASLLDQSSYANITLPNLTTLKIINSIYEWEQEQASLSSHDINYSTQLSLILAGSTSLKRIEVCYNDDKALKTLLHVFGAVPALSSLSSIVIRGQGKLPALCASNLTSIGQIPVPKLKTLHFVCCIKSEGDGTEVKAAFEIMLKRFPKLHVLKIDGCFMMSATNTSTLPKIVLDFPKLDHLTFLELGASCKYLSNFETDKKQPHKKKKKIAINLRPGQPQVNEVGPAGEDVPLLNLMGDESNVHFPISITFPGLMPRLEFVSIGALYVFQTLYLSELPVLKVFRVASAWAQSYPNYFPPATGRKGIREGQPQICNVEELKLPDSFKDCSIIKKIIPHFPHLTNVHLSLPSVKFVRAFAKTMATTGPDCFQKFSMRTQFDFASSLDSCILDNIVKPNEAELEQIRILKAYPHFQNYVKENQIELPYEHPEEEDPDKFCGLRILFKKLKWIRILHLPRTLRLPQGLRHWIDDPQPEFTNTIIGFKKYPFSKAVEIECPPTMKLFTSRLDMSQVADGFNYGPCRHKTDRIKLRILEPTTPSVKQEVKLESSATVPSK